MNNQEIPVINLENFDVSTAAEKRRIAEQLDLACQEVGFFVIEGHGVCEETMANTRMMAENFFAMPLKQKLKVERPPQKISRGYNKFQDRSLSYSMGLSAPPDLQEAFAFGPEEFDGSQWIPDQPQTAMLAGNKWPTTPPGFRSTMLKYDQEMRKLGELMLDILSLALNIDREYFRTKFNRQSSVARMVRYPAQAAEPKAGQLRAGAHTDYGTLTFLRGDPVPGGTEIRTKDGRWLEVINPDKCFVCNIGDALARWSNDRWISTLHRVGNPPSFENSADRISMVYFHSPNHDAVIECLPGCEGDIGPKYKPITFADHYLGKVMKAAHLRNNATIDEARAQDPVEK